MINTGKAPKAVAGKPSKSKPTIRKANKPKGDFDDMSAKTTVAQDRAAAKKKKSAKK